MILLVSSKKDIAGMNIANYILKKQDFKETSRVFQSNPIYQSTINEKQVDFVILNEESVHSQYLLDFFPDAELVVFVSRHSSVSRKPTLSVHVPGNIGDANLGGLKRLVSVAPANAMLSALKKLYQKREQQNLDYAVSYEGTHHGPCLNAPTMFVELGSTELQWKDLDAAAAVGEAAIAGLEEFLNSQSSAVIGFGGTHYNSKFTRMALKGEAVFGHMIPKYAIPYLDLEIISQCIKRTFETVNCAVIDWKGIKSADKVTLLKLIEDVGLKVEKI